jgi:formamidopyrimidine-DNA glycosylase
MPELPEVQALARVLTERAAGRVVARVDPVAINVLKTYDPPPSALQGLTISGAVRHGKFLDIDIDGLHLVMHLSRAGWLQWKKSQPALPPRPGKGPLALRVTLDDGSGFDVTEAGTQKRLAVYIVTDPLKVPGIARLGIDPLDPAFTVEALGLLLSDRGRSQLKGVLSDQSVISGLGNAYTDEALWTARLSPFKPAGGLSPTELATLHAAITETLATAISRADGLGAADLKAEKRAGLNVHARTGLPCPRCGDTIRQVSFADKSLQYCATCQTGGKPLADRRMSKLLK